MGAFDFIGDAFNKDARRRAASAQHDAIDWWKETDTNVDAQQTGPNAFDSLNPDARNAQTRALDQLAGIGAAGGMDEGSKAALQQAQAKNGQQAKSSTDAALARAAAEGRSNSGRALSAQMQAGQGAANANAMAGTQAVADARMRAMNAMAASGQLAGATRGQDQNGASAANQIGQFNAQMRQGAQAQTVQNNMQRAQGVAQNDQAIAGTDSDRAKEARESAGAIGDAVVKGATAAATGGMSAIGDVAGSAIKGMAGKAEGGLIPGEAKVPGDSLANDTVPAKLSPGEVVVPRTVVSEGPDAVKNFVARLLREGR